VDELRHEKESLQAQNDQLAMRVRFLEERLQDLDPYHIGGQGTLVLIYLLETAVGRISHALPQRPQRRALAPSALSRKR